jgi:hypothetical protein
MSTRAKPNKYRAQRTEYDGVTYASKAEACYAVALDVATRAGAYRHWTRQVPFHLGCPENKYVVDFLAWLPDGTTVCIDVKGVETAKFKRDRKLWARYGPCALNIVRRGKIVEVIEPTIPTGDPA